MAESGTAWEKAGKAKKKRSLKRKVLVTLLVVLLIVAAGVIFTPTIASPIVRSMVASKGSQAVPGTLDARSVNLSWLGPQRVQGLTIEDPSGGQVADVDVKADVGLLGLVFGGRDLGTITVSGHLNLDKNDVGELNLLRALVKSDAGPSGSGTGAGGGGGGGGGYANQSAGGRLPPTLKAVVVLDGVQVSYSDAVLRERGLGSVSLDAISGKTDFAVGKTIRSSVKASITGKDRTGDSFQSGTISIVASIDGLIDTNGSIDTARGILNIQVSSDDMDARLADRLFDAPVSFERAFGSLVRLTAQGQGSMSKPSVDFEVASRHIHVGGAIAFDQDDLIVRTPITATIDREGMNAIDPVWLDEATGGSLEVKQMPSIGLAIKNARVPIGSGSLASLGGDVTVDLGAMDALVRVGEGEEATSRRITTSPATVRLGTDSLGNGATMTGELAFTVNERDGGAIGIDLNATGLLDESGAIRTETVPVLRGSLGLTGVDTAVLQPFVAATGLNMNKEVGPTLSMGVDIEPQAGGAISLIRAHIASDNINGHLNLAVEEAQLRAGDPGGHIRVASVGPLLTRQFREQGLRVREGAAVELTLYTLSADLSGLMGGTGLSMSVLDASGEVILGPTSGAILVDGSEKPFQIEQLSAFIEIAGSKKAMQVRTATGGRFDGQPAGQVMAEMLLSGIISETGAFGMPSGVAGRAEFVGIATKIVEPFIKDDRLKPALLIGPTVDLVLEATPLADAKTKLIATLSSDHLTGDGAFVFSKQTLEVDPVEGYTLTHTGLAPVLAGFVDLGEGTSLRPEGGTTEINLSRLIIPLDTQTRALKLGETDMALRVALRNVYLDSDPESPLESTELRQLVVNTRLKPATDPTVRIGSVMYAGREKVEGEGEFTIPGLSAALGGTGDWSLPSLAPQGEFVFAKIPPALLAMGIAMTKIEGLDGAAIASDIAGEVIELRLGLKPTGQTLRGEIAATGARLNLTGDAVFGAAFEQAAARGEIKLSRPSSENLLRAVLPQMAETITIVGTTALRLDASMNANGALAGKVSVPALTVKGLEAEDLRIRLDAELAADTSEAGSTIKLDTLIANAARDDIARINADLKSSASGGLNGTVSADGLKSAWADQLLGTTDLYTGLFGRQIGFKGDMATREGLTTIHASINAPTLRDASDVSLQMADGAIELTKPFRAIWQGDRAWLNARMSRMLGDQTLTLGQDLAVDLRLRSLAIPPTASKSKTNFALDMTARVDELDLTMPGGESRSYRQIQIVARNNAEATGANLVTKGDVRIGGGVPKRAINLTADILNLAEPGMLTPDKAYANVNGTIEHVPTSVIDAFAGTNGLLTRMLGAEVSVDKLVAQRAPLEGGTVLLKLSSPASQAHISGSFQDGTPDGVLENGAFVLDEGGYIELTMLNQSFTRDIFNVVPIFGEMQRTPGEQRASRIDIRSGSIPLGGSIEAVAFDVSADLGSVQYGLGGPITEVLKLTGQNAFGQLGGRIEPFNVRMARGIIDYDSLTVPLGEFAFKSEGSLNLLQKTKDLLVLMPTGAFAVEAFGATGLMGKILDQAATVPLTNKGAFSVNTWKPDFSKAFKPGKLLENIIKDGFEDLLKPKGDKPDGTISPGGGGG